jgi:neutral ceramidase
VEMKSVRNTDMDTRVSAASLGHLPHLSNGLRAGASRVVVTPPLGRPLAGYPQRTKSSDSIHDDLHLRTLVFETGGTRSAILSLDVMAVDAQWVAELRLRVSRELGISPDDLLVAATHTHSGHGEILQFDGHLGHALAALFEQSEGPFDPVSYEYLLRQAATGVKLAVERLVPAHIRIGSDSLDGVASNRVDPTRPVEGKCVAVSVEAVSGGPIATILHFTCHPSVLGDGDAGVSADFPGVACAIVESAVGGVALYLNGALGDISTRFTRRGHGYSEAIRFGRMVGGTVLRALGRAEPTTDVGITAMRTVIHLPTKGTRWVVGASDREKQLTEELRHAEESSQPHGRIRQLKTALQGAQIAVALGPRLSSLPYVPVEVQLLRVGADLDLVAYPAELFSGLSARLSVAVPDRTVLSVCPANGYLGYIPTADAFSGGGYEADTCIVDCGAGESLVDGVIDRFYTHRTT